MNYISLKLSDWEWKNLYIVLPYLFSYDSWELPQREIVIFDSTGTQEWLNIPKSACVSQ